MINPELDSLEVYARKIKSIDVDSCAISTNHLLELIELSRKGLEFIKVCEGLCEENKRK